MSPNHPLRIFLWSAIVSVISLVIGFFYGGVPAVIVLVLLGIMEVSLSFDNAVVNASILERMSEKWQQIFLTVGVLIAVFGMRMLFPLVIVGISTGLNPVDAFSLAMEKGDPSQPGTYGFILHEAHPQIAAFGGIFLLMLFLDFIFEDRDIKWLQWLERPLAQIGKIDYASIIVSAAFLLVIAKIADPAHTVTILISGIAGMITYLLVSALGAYFENRLEEDEEDTVGKVGSAAAKLTGRAAFFTFIYLEIIDASFSFDGVIGAFAITSDPILIALGLGLIGAMFVRSITIFLVRQGTLKDFVYLEHGAHWAIGALAVILIFSIHMEISEIVTGLIGVVLIAAAFITSIIRNKNNPPAEDEEITADAAV